MQYKKRKKSHYLYTLLYLEVCALAAGIWFQQAFSTPLCVSMLIISAGIAGAFYYTYSLKKTFLCLCFFGLGMLSMYRMVQQAKKIQATVLGRTIDAAGEILDISTSSDQRVTVLCKVKKIRERKKATFFCNKKMLILCTISPCTPLKLGDYIVLRNIVIYAPTKPEKRDSFFRRGIAGSAMIYNPRLVFIMPGKARLRSLIARAYEKVERVAQSVLSPKTQSLFRSIFLGKRESLQYETCYYYWGLVHYLTRSGLHVALFFGVITGILKCIPCPLGWRIFMRLILLMAYATLSWSTVPFIRASLVAVLRDSARLMRRHATLLHLLCIVFIGLLIRNPIELFCVEFQLTFALTFTLMLLQEYRTLSQKNCCIP